MFRSTSGCAFCSAPITYCQKSSGSLSPPSSETHTFYRTVHGPVFDRGTVDGALDFLIPKGFVTERNKRKDGSYDVKFESYG